MKEIFTALAKAQSEFKSIPKNKEVKKKGKTKDGAWFEYSYFYADLDEIIEQTRKPLTTNGLSFYQTIHTTECVTFINHTSGEFIQSSCPIILNTDDMQKIGAAITYAKRYGLSMALGVSTDEDADANELLNEPYAVTKRPAPVRVDAPVKTQPAPTSLEPSTTAAEINMPPAKQFVRYPLSEKQLNRLYAIAKTQKWSAALVDAYISKNLNKKPVDMSRKEYEDLCAMFGSTECTQFQQDAIKGHMKKLDVMGEFKKAKDTFVDHTLPPHFNDAEMPTEKFPF